MDALAHGAPREEGRARRLIRVGGLVQGVGFRPFVYRLAETWGVAGWVANEPAGVTIDIEGDAAAVAGFLADLPRAAPALSRIERLESVEMPPTSYARFEIRESKAAGAREALVSPDLATCPDCLAELFDPNDRRYRYPFINCTNCGPRYTIIDGLPYDRPLTAMRAFPMCPECADEYHDPRDRRFHAQPDACPECGPRVWFTDSSAVDWPAIEAAAARLIAGGVIAVKGLGGFHLACDAGNEAAVAQLRAAKHRPLKPFAIMVADIEAAQAICRVDVPEAALLASPRAPIVLLDRLPAELATAQIAASVAPGQLTLGVMLPYTPLQHLLLRLVGRPLVMTSGNISEEPLVAENDEALRDLAPIATAGMLLHNRDIPHRCDDSVARIVAGRQIVIRRARGCAPSPLPFSGPASRGGRRHHRFRWPGEVRILRDKGRAGVSLPSHWRAIQPQSHRFLQRVAGSLP
ncbi:MAG: carbamoyltransferase HypF [Chloroflexota bacterium]